MQSSWGRRDWLLGQVDAGLLRRTVLALAIGVIAFGPLGAACGDESVGDEETSTQPTQGEHPMVTSTIATGAGVAGERWGGFIFVDPDRPEPYERTPAVAGHVPNEDAIPDGHPGLNVFSTVAEANTAFAGAPGAVRLGYVPKGYELMQAWIIKLDDGRIVDYSLEYRRAESNAVPFGPDLWVGWTDRAPRPLPAFTKENRLPTEQVGLPVRKLTVRGSQAVFQEWLNPPNRPLEAGVRSSLNWFEGGRLWFVQAYEPLDLLYDVAEGIEPAR